jgi:hypothetical protein
MKKKITGMQIQNIANSNAGKWRDIGIKLDVCTDSLENERNLANSRKTFTGKQKSRLFWHCNESTHRREHVS